jgi:hypothetical protein
MSDLIMILSPFDRFGRIFFSTQTNFDIDQDGIQYIKHKLALSLLNRK